jgi:hypothetical protein
MNILDGDPFGASITPAPRHLVSVSSRSAAASPGKGTTFALRMLMQVAVRARRAHGDMSMGDKSPKSARKQASQKQIKVDQETRLKQSATAAKQVASKKK